MAMIGWVDLGTARGEDGSLVTPKATTITDMVGRHPVVARAKVEARFKRLKADVSQFKAQNDPRIQLRGFWLHSDRGISATTEVDNDLRLS